jgi:hypothetical protein
MYGAVGKDADINSIDLQQIQGRKNGLHLPQADSHREEKLAQSFQIGGKW